MRALLWSDYFWPAIGGTEVFGLNLVRGLRERGIELEVVANTTEDANERDANRTVHDFVVHRLPLRRALAQRDLGRIAEVRQILSSLVARLRPALVHEISLGPGDVFLNALRERTAVPCLVTLQQHVPAALLAPSTPVGHALRTAAWIVTVSAAVREELLRALPDVSARCSVIHPGPCVPELDAAAWPAAPRLLCLGRMVADKGFDIALEAFATLAPAHPDARLVIAGDGPERAALRARAHALGLARRVDFIGWVHPDATPALIDSATMVLTPSRREPMGLVALEAAARGRPVVASRIGGLPEIVQDGVTGLLVPAADVPALSAAVTRLLRDPEHAAGLGRAARARVQQRFAWTSTLDAYHALYHRVAESRGR